MRYVGRLKSNGKVFDETKGKATFSFRLGVGEVIKGEPPAAPRRLGSQKAGRVRLLPHVCRCCVCLRRWQRLLMVQPAEACAGKGSLRRCVTRTLCPPASPCVSRAGWDRGVEGMRVGDKRRLTIPPQMAYGSSGVRGAIPPNGERRRGCTAASQGPAACRPAPLQLAAPAGAPRCYACAKPVPGNRVQEVSSWRAAYRQRRAACPAGLAGAGRPLRGGSPQRAITAGRCKALAMCCIHGPGLRWSARLR